MSDIIIKQPVGVLNKAIKLDIKSALITSIKTIIGTTTQVALNNASAPATATKGIVDLIKTGSLVTTEEELAWLLVIRSVTNAIDKTLYEFKDFFVTEISDEQLAEITSELETAINSVEVKLESDFFDKVKELEFVKDLQPILQRWLKGLGIDQYQAQGIYNQFKSTLVTCFHEEDSDNSELYAPIFNKLDSNFLRADKAEKQLQKYRNWLEQEVNKRMFEESFGLKQVYIPLRAYYETRESKDTDDMHEHNHAPRHDEVTKHVCNLHDEIHNWLADNAYNEQDSLRVISGGPGSGKSSFAKILAYQLAEQRQPVLFIPLHRLKLETHLKTALEEYISVSKHYSHVSHALLDENNLLIIFDGLDELTMQAGAGVKETAKEFVDEVKTMLRYHSSKKWRAIITGREIAVQSQKNQFKQAKNVFYLLPYFIEEDKHGKYQDKDNLLAQDQRDDWWCQFAQCKGLSEQGLPPALNTENLQPINQEPLLNYLLSLSYLNNNITFDENTNLNVIYADLLSSVHKRKYANNRSVEDVYEIKKSDFERILQEIALAVWHNNGRVATLEQIKIQCAQANLTTKLDILKNNVDSGVTKLLMAFYFREFGGQQSDKTFEFTHKSFGEYLTARRIMRELADIYDDYKHDIKKRGEPVALERAFASWLIMFGRQELDGHVIAFVTGEMSMLASTSDGKEIIESYQQLIVELLQMAIDNKAPIKMLNLDSFDDILYQSANAEHALLTMHAQCAKQTKKVIEKGIEGDINAWLQRIGSEKVSSLSYIKFSNETITSSYFRGVDFSYSQFDKLIFERSNFILVKFERSEFFSPRVDFFHTTMIQVLFVKVCLESADFRFSLLTAVIFKDTNLIGSSFYDSSLRVCSFKNVDLTHADFNNTHIDQKTIDRFDNVTFKDTIVTGTVLANLPEAATDDKGEVRLTKHFPAKEKEE